MNKNTNFLEKILGGKPRSDKTRKAVANSMIAEFYTKLVDHLEIGGEKIDFKMMYDGINSEYERVYNPKHTPHFKNGYIEMSPMDSTKSSVLKDLKDHIKSNDSENYDKLSPEQKAGELLYLYSMVEYSLIKNPFLEKKPDIRLIKDAFILSLDQRTAKKFEDFGKKFRKNLGIVGRYEFCNITEEQYKEGFSLLSENNKVRNR